MHLPGHTLTYQIPPGHSHTLNTHIEIILFMASHHFLFWWPRPTTSPSSNFLWTHLYLITTHSGSTCHVLNLTDPQSYPQLSTLLPQWSLPFHHIWYSSLEFQHCSWALSSSDVMPSFLRLNLMIHYHLNYALNSILDSLALWPPAPALTQLHTSDCPWESQTPCIQMKFLPDLLFFSFSISLLQWGALNPPKDSNQKSESHSWSPSVPQSWHSTSLYYLLKLVLSLYTARGALTEAFIFSTNDKKKKPQHVPQALTSIHLPYYANGENILHLPFSPSPPQTPNWPEFYKISVILYFVIFLERNWRRLTETYTIRKEDMVRKKKKD